VTDARWNARFTIPTGSAAAAERLLAALAPEAAREVPKATAVLGRPSPEVVTIDVRASDAGALRAAANTYLGWVDLALAADAVALRAVGGDPRPKPLSP
jgi:tRNA threonylcarbamoyladenosine modification (KEOPS) complex  Pcc1 subunit